MPITINTEITLDHILTLLTIIGGLFAWFFHEYRKHSFTRYQQAQEGAIRLLLRLLKERNQKIVPTSELFDLYQSPRLKRMRKDYCGYDFRFRDFSHFESILYALDAEKKVRYSGGEKLLFRRYEKIDNELLDPDKEVIVLQEDDKKRVYEMFVSSFNDHDISANDLKKIARMAYRVYPRKVHEFLRSEFNSENPTTRMRSLEIMEDLLEL
jgi:hypothetical protein